MPTRARTICCWILSPTAWLVGVVARRDVRLSAGRRLSVAGTPVPDREVVRGDQLHDRRVRHAGVRPVSSCRFGTDGGGTGAGGSLLASYAAAVVVNAVRVVIAMWLAAHPFAVSTLSPADIHRLEGIAVYFGGLVLLHELVRVFDQRQQGGPLRPAEQTHDDANRSCVPTDGSSAGVVLRRHARRFHSPMARRTPAPRSWSMR